MIFLEKIRKPPCIGIPALAIASLVLIMTASLASVAGADAHTLEMAGTLATVEDEMPPTIENALAIPDMMSLISYSYSSGTGSVGTGNYWGYLLVEAYDADGIQSVTLNFRPLFEKMFANVEFDEGAWEEFLEEMESVPMESWGDDIWGFDFWGEYWFWPIDMLYDYGLITDESAVAQMLSQEIQLGDFTIPVTVTDWEGSESTSTIELAVVDVMVPLEKGWNLRSIPVTLANARWGDIVSLRPGHDLWYDAALRIENGEWVVVDENYEMKPLEAIFIHATGRDQMGLAFSRKPTAPPVRQLGAGWNLVGYAPAGYVEWYWDWGETYWWWQDMYAQEAMVSVEQTPGGLRGYTDVVSPGEYLSYTEIYEYKGYDLGGYSWYLWQDTWVYTASSWTSYSMQPFGGYWVFMENPDRLAGYSSTPVSWYYCGSVG